MEWNVVVSTREHGFAYVFDLMREFGEVERTDYFNVLAVKVEDVDGFLEGMRDIVEQKPHVLDYLSRAVPVTICFTFQDAEQFESRCRAVVEPWAVSLVDRSFHVRVHRRGFKGRLSSQEQERLMDRHLLEQVEARGGRASVSFDDPDVIIAIESIGQTAGASLWSREDRRRYPFLRLD